MADKVSVAHKINLCFSTVLFSGLLVDMVWKSFGMSVWYADLVVSIILLCQMLVLTYEAKQVLSLTLIGDAAGYRSTTLGELSSLHAQLMGEFHDGEETQGGVRAA